ncbi:phosphocholine cytidylyltransferase family protein [Alphaproteobacteria bacterium]|nr:phosphocholine cytidylyltransferase family protein [Alphaproteobacteria bacterium]
MTEAVKNPLAEQALIVAAGRGSRMRGMTEDAPKCLVELAGKSLLEWQISALKSAGLSDVAAVGGYLNERLRPFIDVAFVNSDWSRTNMVSTMICATSRLRAAATVISYSDIVYNRNIVDALRSSEGDIVVAYDRHWLDLWSSRFDDPLDDAETFRIRDGRISEIGATPNSVAEVEGQFMGLMKIEPRGWRAIEDLLSGISKAKRDRMDTTGLLNLLIKDGIKVCGCPIDGGWVEVDTETDLSCYERCLEQSLATGQAWSHDWRSRI